MPSNRTLSIFYRAIKVLIPPLRVVYKNSPTLCHTNIMLQRVDIMRTDLQLSPSNGQLSLPLICYFTLVKEVWRPICFGMDTYSRVLVQVQYSSSPHPGPGPWCGYMHYVLYG